MQAAAPAAVPLSAYASTLLLILIVPGLFMRFSACAFLFMTRVIEIFVYPHA